jgi:hypothetical protein
MRSVAVYFVDTMPRRNTRRNKIETNRNYSIIGIHCPKCADVDLCLDMVLVAEILTKVSSQEDQWTAKWTVL